MPISETHPKPMAPDPAPAAPEERYMLSVLRAIIDPVYPIEHTTDLDWDQFYNLLIRNRLNGIFHHWGKAHKHGWPPALRDKLREIHFNTLYFGTLYEAHIQRILIALEAAKIPVIVLKGWAFIHTLYEGDPSRRSYDDIDILVPPEAAARAENIIRALGYTPETGQPWPGHIRRFRNGRAYLSPENLASFPRQFMLGLHWGLLDTPYFEKFIDLQSFFEHAEPVQVAQQACLVPAPEDHLVYALGHLALHHEYDRILYRFFEFALLIKISGPAFDWGKVCTLAQSWRLVIPTQTGLTHLDQLFPGLIPADVLADLHRMKPSKMEKWIHNQVVQNRDNAAARALIAWLTMPGIPRRLRFILETALPSPTYMRQRYDRSGDPPVLISLYLKRYQNAIRQIMRTANSSKF